MDHKVCIPIVLILCLASCGGNTNTGGIELNNGEKWKVNVEMMPPITRSQLLVSEFVANHEKDFKTLADQLSENNRLLISSCTMKGRSHEELHKWLLPYMALVDELASANDAIEANQVLRKIEQSFETFGQYFY